MAAISFLASCTHATLTPEIKTYDEANKNLKARSASMYSSRNTINTTINGSHTSSIETTDQGPHTIIIETGGTLGDIGNNDRIIYAHASGNNTLTLANLINNGTINGKVAVEHDNNFNGTITVNTFENTGQVNGQIYMGVWGGNSGTLNIDKFNNSGTIKSNDGVFFEGKNTTINSFNNNGTINGSSSGIFVYGGNIQTLENSGTIISNGNYSNHAGIKLERGGSIENIINTGTIESKYSGIMVTWGKFGTLTIRDGGVVRGEYIGIGVGQWQALGDLYIDGKNTLNNNTVSGVYGKSYGISLDLHSRTQTIELKNGGVIKGDISGIRLDGDASLSGEMILSGEGSRVEGGRDAGIFNFGGKIQGSITVKEGATVTATSNQAISNVGSGSITGGITVSGKNTKLKGNIINADSASIGSNIKIENGAKVEGGLVNQGSGSISGNVQVSGGSTINSIINTGDGAISGSVQVSGGSTIDSITN
ncbi:hypothetical protein C3I04_04575, partial [Campylobacter jejuni]